MPSDPHRLAAIASTQAGLITTDQLEEAGTASSSISDMLRTGRLRRLHRGVYLLDPDLHDDPLPFWIRLRAARLRHGEETIAVLQTAGTIHGLIGMPPEDDIHLARTPNHERAQVPGIGLQAWKLRPDEVTSTRAGPATTVLRTLADLVLRSERVAAVSMVDAALNSGRLQPADVDALTAALVDRRGAVQARRRLAEVDGRAQSPLESRVRLTAKDVGLPPDELQVPIRSRDGALLGYGDLGWRRSDGRWLVGECDGAEVHAQPKALYYDRSRANSFLVDADTPILRFTWRDCDRPAYVRWLILGGLRVAA